jgi:hypothetical protein
MPKRPQPDGHPLSLSSSRTWSVGSNSLTPIGQSELLKQLGSQMREDYQAVVEEPVPDYLRVLLRRLEKPGGSTDEGDR